ncbi:TPA: hypothetical protein L4S50_005996, partial [Pseudomonas aeruginosa]|nr:hypothetical protein [Pseudomonas aeruginosa]
MINKRNAIFLSMILIFFSIACIGSAGVRVWNFYTLFDSGKIAENFRAMPRLFNSVPIKKSGAAHFFEKNLRDMPGSFSFQGHEIGFKDWLASSNTTGLIVLSDDRIAFEEYYLGNSAKSLAIGWSLSKSLMSLLIGMAVDEGSIH